MALRGRPKKYADDMVQVSARIPEALKRRMESKARILDLSLNDAVLIAVRVWIEEPLDDTPVGYSGPGYAPPVEIAKETGHVSQLMTIPDSENTPEYQTGSIPPELGVRWFMDEPTVVSKETRELDEVRTALLRSAERSWLGVYAKCKAAGDEGANQFAELVAHIKKWPDGFKGWPEARQIIWLDKNHPA